MRLHADDKEEFLGRFSSSRELTNMVSLYLHWLIEGSFPLSALDKQERKVIPKIDRVLIQPTVDVELAEKFGLFCIQHGVSRFSVLERLAYALMDKDLDLIRKAKG